MTEQLGSAGNSTQLQPPFLCRFEAAKALLAFSIFLLLFQLYWFGKFNLERVDFDGISYVGIARHLIDHKFAASINGFRSPAISWLIALFAPIDSANLLHVGKLVTMLSLLLAISLAFLFTKRCTGSPLAAAFVVFWLTVARGFVPLSTQFVSPDYLFAALSTLYFVCLLHCFRSESDHLRYWALLGLITGGAFLVKAFALPWLVGTTCFGALLMIIRKRSFRASWSLAFVIPLLVAAAWAVVLHAKFGIWTTGTQLKTNLYQWTLKVPLSAADSPYSFLVDEGKTSDAYQVGEPLPPGSLLLVRKLQVRVAVTAALRAELHNLPVALKEMTVILTPLGLVAVFMTAIRVWRARRERWPEFAIVSTILASSATLVIAYSCLVFDGRYTLPLYAPLMAVAARSIFCHSSVQAQRLQQRIILLLILTGLFATLIYASSPWLTATRDYQSGPRYAASRLLAHGSKRLISVGAGPYPEHGVGWEAGFIAGSFSNSQVVAFRGQLPHQGSVAAFLSDLHQAPPATILVWGNPQDTSYAEIRKELEARFSQVETIVDFRAGAVGFIAYP